MPRANLALVNIPVTLIAIMAPLIIRHTKQPLIWFGGSYVLCLISEIPIAAYIYFTPFMISSNYYYPLLILLLAFNEFVMVLRLAAMVGFFASVSEPRIGGTYMTLLATLYNLGFAINSSIILYAANWFPKKYAFVIAVGICVVLGIIWLGLSVQTLKRLQNLPIYKWYLMPETITDNTTTLEKQNENDHEASLLSDKETTGVTPKEE